MIRSQAFHMVRGFNLDLSSIAAPMCRLAEVDVKSSIAAIQLEMKVEADDFACSQLLHMV